MDTGGRGLREAVQQYLDAIESKPGHSWLSAAAHALEESTRRGYTAALRRPRKRSGEQFAASPRQVLELEIKEMVASENVDGNLKKSLSACRQLDKLRLHPMIVETADWQVVKSLAKRRVRGGSTLVRRAPMELFVWLAEQIVDLASAEVVALAFMSVACVLRVGEAATVRTSARGDVWFNGEKGRLGIGMWRWVRGQSGGCCSSGTSDGSSTGAATCPFPSKTRRSYRRDGKRLFEGRISKGTGGMPCAGVERRSCGSGAPASRRSCSREDGSPPMSPKITATQRTRGLAREGCSSQFRWTGCGGGQAACSSTGHKNDVWTICGRDGSERICDTLHLGDALGLRRVRSAQRDGK